mmetsp:Transcript_21220/g.54397  ORF Transcript_21220/g.54397 Transcript_21220/m.54397 type:complete len:213 (+) Transcript_21220:600-1238(+)
MQGGEGGAVPGAWHHPQRVCGHRGGAAGVPHRRRRVFRDDHGDTAGAGRRRGDQLAPEDVARPGHGGLPKVLHERTDLRALPPHREELPSERRRRRQTRCNAHHCHVPPPHSATRTEAGDLHHTAARVCAQPQQLRQADLPAGVPRGDGGLLRQVLPPVLPGPVRGDGVRPRAQRAHGAVQHAAAGQDVHLPAAGCGQAGAPDHSDELPHER